MKKNILLLSALALFAITFTACSGEEDSENKDSKTADTKDLPADTANTDMEDDMDENAIDESNDEEVILPSPVHVADILNNSGLNYTNGLTNPVDRVSGYSTEFKQSLNFGVYSMDLAYLVMNEKNSEALNYLKAVRELAVQTGLDKIFASEDLVNRFENNLGNNDSIMPLLFEIHERTDAVLAENEDKSKTLVHFAGAWLEGMYLGSKTASSDNNTELGTAVVSQINILGNIIKGLKAKKNKSGAVKDLIADLEEISNMYFNFDSVKNNADAAYLDPTLTNEELNQLTKKIQGLRNEVVSA